MTIVLAYLMKKHGMSLSEALEHVKSRRPQASPNAGFMSQLQAFERFLHGALLPLLFLTNRCILLPKLAGVVCLLFYSMKHTHSPVPNSF